MLQKLFITNYAIIEVLEIHFSNHLNIITGETGAGKSILMGALGLILGERADTGILRDKNEKCIIEGTFLANPAEVADFLEKNDLDYSPELIVRREISPAGKSRAFINDTPATLAQLKQLSSFLVDLHQQFDTLELGKNDFQREVMDALADTSKLLEDYRINFRNYKQSQQRVAELKNRQSVANKEQDYHQYLWEELDEANFLQNEVEELDEELKLMSNAENIKFTLSAAYFELEGNEPSVIQQLKQIAQKLGGLEGVLPAAGELANRLKSAVIEIEDISSEVDSLNDKVVYDAERIELLNARTTLAYQLFKKHNVLTTSELLAVQADLETKLAQIGNLESEIARLEEEAKMWELKCIDLGKKISERRNKAVKPFEDQVNQMLAQVGMPNARVKVEINDTDLNSYGSNEIIFLFNANKSAAFQPIRKVASGGELSRLMLIIKSLVAQKVQLPTLIFDEIDSGISGEAARQVGIIIKQLSASHQLISITHQPQIAAKADTHFFVYKNQMKDRIVTSIRVLNHEERLAEIATMLSGSKPTAAAFENAREMMLNE